MERFAFIIVALLGILLTACASDPGRGGLNIRPVRMPEWTYHGRHPDYPESDYIVAYGLARTPREAAEVAEQRLEILICDFAVTPHQALFKDTQFAQVVTEQAAWFGIDEFTDAVRSDAASNGFEAVAVRAIQRNELKLRARALLPAAQSALAEASAAAGGPGQHRQAHGGMGRVLSAGGAGGGARAAGFGYPEPHCLRQAGDRAAVVVGAAGAGQDRPAGRRPAPARQRRAARSAGAARQLPRHAGQRRAAGLGPGAGFRGVVEGDRATDAGGRASARVHQFTSTGDGFGYVRASLDLDHLIGRRLGIAMNVWLWRVLLPSRDNGQLVVKVKETEQGETPLPEPLFTPEIRKWADGRSLASTTAEPDTEKYLYHLVLEGEVDVTTFTSEGTPGAYVSGTFTLTDRETGTMLYRYSLGIQRSGQAGNTEASVKLLAMRDGAAEVMAEFASRIIVTLPAPGDEYGRAR
ncbi:MAG: hypothetical protein M5U25_18080 [Planctomycetota bacterium]|nr:hypothetical protein [Planctomycetota bacterium]